MITKLALVIGCRNYLFSKPLGNTLNDARDMKAALEALGYEVIYLEDPSLTKLTEQVAEFAKKAKQATERVVYYAGHGVQVNGVNYLLPVTCKAKETAELPDQALGLSQLMGALPEKGVNIVILDACRDNPFSRSFRSAGGSSVLAGLGNQERPTGTLIAYATKPGDVASDASPNGRNGLYTGELLKHLKTPGLRVEDVFIRTRAGVMVASNKQQQPWDESSLVLSFYFNPSKIESSVVVPSGIKSGSNPVNINKSPNSTRKIGIEMVFIRGNETISDFWMSKTPVTVKQYRIYCVSTGKDLPMSPNWGWIDEHPIVNVDWTEATAYAEWAGCRLPTSAEFLYAARDGGKDIKYPWGNVWDGSKVWSRVKPDNAGRTASVHRGDHIFVNSLGVSDMAGNVWQWCSDGPDSGNRYYKGGSRFDNNPEHFRCVTVTSNTTDTRDENLGFRLCLSE